MTKLYPVILLVTLVLLGWWWIFGDRAPGFDTDRSPVMLTEREAEVSPGPATALRLVIQFSDNEVKVLSALPRRSTVREPKINPSDLLANEAVMIAYRALDARGQVLSDGLVVIPLVTRAEFQDLQSENKLQRFEERLVDPVIKVSIPFDAGMTSLVFSRLEPDEKTDVERWERVPLNTVLLNLEDEGSVNVD